MQIKIATSKITKRFAPVVELAAGEFRAVRQGIAIEFLRNGRGEEATCLRVRRLSQLDDAQTDYFPGRWCDSVKQAIDYALETIERDAAEHVEAPAAARVLNFEPRG